MKICFALIISLLFFFTSFAQGSGNAAEFNGTNYIDLGSAYRVLSNPITFTCWVKRGNTQYARIFLSNYYPPGYSGIWVQITNPGALAFSYGDGTGSASSDRRSVISSGNHAFLNVWMHLAIVMTSMTSGQVYANGVLVNSFTDGSGGAWFQSTNGDGLIGVTNGGNGLEYNVGELDEITLWNKALTATEVRNLVCRKTNASASLLLGNYDFDAQVGTQVFDSSPNAHNGTIVNNVAFPTSGAAIGDTSYYSYVTAGVSTFSQTLTSGHQIEVSNISSGTPGVQVYEVLSAPNSTFGLPANANAQNYFGVFMTRTASTTKTFRLKINNYHSGMSVFQRSGNDDLNWTAINPTSVVGTVAEFPMHANFKEYYIYETKDCRVDLGPDIDTCLPVNLWLKDIHFNSGKTYTWNGTTVADSLQISAPGTYIVEMDSSGCVVSDTIIINERSVSVDLGPDISTCDPASLWVKDLNYNSAKTYTWNGTMIADSIQVSTLQQIIVVVDSAGCLAYDTLNVSIVNYPAPVFVSQVEKCVENSFMLELPTGNYTFLWPNGSTFNSYTIRAEDVLSFYTISPCGDSTLHTITVIQNICDNPCYIFVPNTFTPNDDSKNDVFSIGVNCNITYFSIQIFNRWGNAVYHTENPYFEWDGIVDGVVEEGTYTYIIQYSGFDEDMKTKTGLINILR